MWPRPALVALPEPRTPLAAVRQERARGARWAGGRRGTAAPRLRLAVPGDAPTGVTCTYCVVEDALRRLAALGGRHLTVDRHLTWAKCLAGVPDLLRGWALYASVRSGASPSLPHGHSVMHRRPRRAAARPVRWLMCTIVPTCVQVLDATCGRPRHGNGTPRASDSLCCVTPSLGGGPLQEGVQATLTYRIRS